MPWHHYDIARIQAHLDHAYWRAFIDEYTQQYSLISLASPLELINIASYIHDKASVGISLVWQTFHSAKGEEKSGNLPIPFWFAEFGNILRHVYGMLILCCHVEWTCVCRVW